MAETYTVIDGQITPSEPITELFEGVFEDEQTDELSDVSLLEGYDESDLLQGEEILDEESTEMVTGDFVTYSDLSPLLQVNALAQAYYNDQTTAYGTFNSQILDLLDRIVDGYPSDYEYVAFRTSVTDTYATKMYIGKHGFRDGNKLRLRDGCDEISFIRSTGTNAHLYYTVRTVDSGSVLLADDSIIYSNISTGLPTLGDPRAGNLSISLFVIPVLVACLFFILGRKK